MDIKQEKLKLRCPHCNNKIVLTYHSEKCPKCGTAFDEEQVKSTFHNYESALANNKFYQAGEKMTKVGKGMEEAGSAMSSIGCAMMSVTIFVILILLLLL